MSPRPRLWLTNVLTLVITPIANAAGRKATYPAGKTAASASVPSRETMNLSTNCMTVKEICATTIGAASFSMYFSEVSSLSAVCESNVDSSDINEDSVLLG
jgi:hypothetical protein